MHITMRETFLWHELILSLPWEKKIKNWTELFLVLLNYQQPNFDSLCRYFTGRLFIADTNNSVIRYLDLNKKEAELLTLELKGVQPPVQKSRSMKRLRKRLSSDTQTITVEGSSSSEGNLSIKISLPEEYHFSKVPHPFPIVYFILTVIIYSYAGSIILLITHVFYAGSSK